MQHRSSHLFRGQNVMRRTIMGHAYTQRDSILPANVVIINCKVLCTQGPDASGTRQKLKNNLNVVQEPNFLSPQLMKTLADWNCLQSIPLNTKYQISCLMGGPLYCSLLDHIAMREVTNFVSLRRRVPREFALGLLPYRCAP